MYDGIDLSHWNGPHDFTSDGASFAIMKLGGSNSGRYVDSAYTGYVDQARAAGEEVGHYWFNGDGDPAEDADWFCDHLHDYRAGDGIVLDVEDEGDRTAWDPWKSLTWLERVGARLGTRCGAYMNRSTMNRWDWSPVVDAGVWLWIAYPTTAADPGAISWWPDWSIWQHSSDGGLDRNRSRTTLAELAGTTPQAPLWEQLDEEAAAWRRKHPKART